MRDSTGTNNKRQRVDEERTQTGAEMLRAEEGRVVKLGVKLQSMLGGRSRCGEEELVPLLLAKKRLKVVQTIKVQVQTMSGSSFSVKLESDAEVRHLKAEIEETEGTPVFRQDLLMLGGSAEEGSEEPLLDDFMLADSCAVSLCIAVKPGK